MRKDCGTCIRDEFGDYCKHCERPAGKPPSKWKPVVWWTPDTNADRIRAMSDEELADIVVCPHTGNWDLCRDDCKKCRLEWLKQPVEPTTNADRCVCCGAIIPGGNYEQA